MYKQVWMDPSLIPSGNHRFCGGSDGSVEGSGLQQPPPKPPSKQENSTPQLNLHTALLHLILEAPTAEEYWEYLHFTVLECWFQRTERSLLLTPLSLWLRSLTDCQSTTLGHSPPPSYLFTHESHSGTWGELVSLFRLQPDRWRKK